VTDQTKEQLQRKGFFVALAAALMLFFQRVVSATTNKTNWLTQVLGGGTSTNGQIAVTLANGQTAWVNVGTNLAIAAGSLNATAGTPLNFADYVEIPGTPNGTIVAFTLTNAPNPPTSLGVFKNGQLMSATDYTLSGAVITFSVAPLATDNLQASYRF
jgi:hypothetical protein